MVGESRRLQSPQRPERIVERLDVETGEIAPRVAPWRSTARRLTRRLKDRELDTAEVGRQMNGAIAVILGIERYAQSAVESAGSLSISRKEHDRGHLNRSSSLAGWTAGRRGCRLELPTGTRDGECQRRHHVHCFAVREPLFDTQ